MKLKNLLLAILFISVLYIMNFGYSDLRNIEFIFSWEIFLNVVLIILIVLLLPRKKVVKSNAKFRRPQVGEEILIDYFIKNKRNGKCNIIYAYVLNKIIYVYAFETNNHNFYLEELSSYVIKKNRRFKEVE